MNALYLFFKKYLILSFFIFIFAAESLFAGPSQSSESTNQNSDNSSTTDTSGDGGNYSSGYTRSKYSSVRKRKFTKVKEIVDSYPNLKTYLENNQIPVEKLSYSDLEKTISDMKFQTLNSQRSPATVISTNSSALSGPSCLPQIVEVKSGADAGSLTQISINMAMNHNTEQSHLCAGLLGVANITGTIKLKCANAALTVVGSDCTYKGCPTVYKDEFSSVVHNEPIDKGKIELSSQIEPLALGTTVQKNCSDIYKSRNIANVRGSANFTCTTSGWQHTNNCEIRECEDTFTVSVPTTCFGSSKNSACSIDFDLTKHLQGPDVNCVKNGNIDFISATGSAYGKYGNATNTTVLNSSNNWTGSEKSLYCEDGCGKGSFLNASFNNSTGKITMKVRTSGFSKSRNYTKPSLFNVKVHIKLK